MYVTLYCNKVEYELKGDRERRIKEVLKQARELEDEKHHVEVRIEY